MNYLLLTHTRSHDSDDEEDVSRWIQEDSGYSEPKVWTHSKRLVMKDYIRTIVE